MIFTTQREVNSDIHKKSGVSSTAKKDVKQKGTKIEFFKMRNTKLEAMMIKPLKI